MNSKIQILKIIVSQKCFEYDVTGSSSTGRGAWNEIVGLTFRVGEAVATQIDANTIWFTGTLTTLPTP